MLVKQKQSKRTKMRVFSMLLGTSGASLLGDLLKVKGTIRAAEGTVWADQDI